MPSGRPRRAGGRAWAPPRPRGCVSGQRAALCCSQTLARGRRSPAPAHLHTPRASRPGAGVGGSGGGQPLPPRASRPPGRPAPGSSSGKRASFALLPASAGLPAGTKDSSLRPARPRQQHAAPTSTSTPLSFSAGRAGGAGLRQETPCAASRAARPRGLCAPASGPRGPSARAPAAGTRGGRRAGPGLPGPPTPPERPARIPSGPRLRPPPAPALTAPHGRPTARPRPTGPVALRPRRRYLVLPKNVLPTGARARDTT